MKLTLWAKRSHRIPKSLPTAVKDVRSENNTKYIKSQEFSCTLLYHVYLSYDLHTQPAYITGAVCCQLLFISNQEELGRAYCYMKHINLHISCIHLRAHILNRYFTQCAFACVMIDGGKFSARPPPTRDNIKAIREEKINSVFIQKNVTNINTCIPLMDLLHLIRPDHLCFRTSCSFILCVLVSVFKLSWSTWSSYVKNHSGILWEPYVNKTLWLS